MTRKQARQRVWKQVHAFLALAIDNEVHWLSHTPAPEYQRLAKKERERMDAAAREVLVELSERCAL